MTGAGSGRKARDPWIARERQVALVESSPLRAADPRTKLALSSVASLAVMLPLEKIIVAIGIYVIMLGWARLLHVAAAQVWRLKWVLTGLFIIDWWWVGLDLAAIVTLRLILLAGAFALFFSTTTPRELCLALEWFRLPYRYAFTVSLAFQSVDLLNAEWRTIREAQRARGAWEPPRGLRELLETLRDWVALSVPAIVMTTKRAWTMTEAAYARGFDSPHRRPFHRLHMRPLDWSLLALTLAASVALVIWR